MPTCGAVCGKVLTCGNHYCTAPCHAGPCAECEQKIMATCPCGSTSQKVYCRKAPDFRCEKKCKAKLACGRHECAEICCPARREANSPKHVCRRECRRQLPCGHACKEPCHRGACPSCYNIVTDELSCRCGRTVLEPPQPCGTKEPDCPHPCTMRHTDCEHEPLPHPCHYGPCPKCHVPVDRECVGGHTIVRGVMCSAEVVLCGNTCAKPLACGHTCPKRCHAGPCQEEGKKGCAQKCGKALECGHVCNQKCHPTRDACGACTATVELACECGIKVLPLKCAEYKKRLDAARAEAATKAASADADADADHDGDTVAPEIGLRAPCTADCAYERRLSALAGVSGGGGGKLSAPKTVFGMRMWARAKANVDWVESVEKHLGNFVSSGADQKILPPMNRERRALVHEMAFYYGVQSEAVDREPNRTCVLTRTDRSRVPKPLLSAAAYDDKQNPANIAANIFRASSPEVAKNSVIVLEGHFNEVTVHGWLKQFHGKFFVLQPDDMSTVAPKLAAAHGHAHGRAAKTTAPNGEPDNVPYVVVFPVPSDAAAAFSMLRRVSIPVTFHRFGEQPPLRNVGADGGSGATVVADQRAHYYVDPAAAGFEGGGGGGGAATPWSAGAAGRAAAPASPKLTTGEANRGSYAAMLGGMPRKETARQKETRKTPTVETGNKFSALRK